MSSLQFVLSKLVLLVLLSASSLNAQPLGGSTGYGVDGAASNWVSVPIPAGTPVSTIGPTTANGQGGALYHYSRRGSLLHKMVRL